MSYLMVKPFEDVELKGYASPYRAYALPPEHPRGPFLFVCLYEDDIRYFDEVIVKRKLMASNYCLAQRG